MKDAGTIRMAHAAGRRRGGLSVSCLNENSGFDSGISSAESGSLPGFVSRQGSEALLNTAKCEPQFLTIAELADRWRCSRAKVYSLLRGYDVVDFAPSPGRRGRKLVSAETVRRIEQEHVRRMR